MDTSGMIEVSADGQPMVEVSADGSVISESKMDPPVVEPDVEVPSVNASVSAPTVNVESPTVNVEAPKVNVDGPAVNVDAPAVNVEAPSVNVEAPAVNVEAPSISADVEDEAAKAENDVSVEVAAPAVTASLETPKASEPDTATLTKAKAAKKKLLIEDNVKRNYTLNAITPVGAEIQGLNLSEAISEETIKQLKNDVHKYKVLVFRDQGVLSGDRQIDITEWFGEIETAGFELHDKSPDRRILRVSNDESEGYVGFGTAGFHVDGSFMEKPNAHSIYHMVSAPSEGETYFVAWSDVMNGLPRSKRHLWRRLSMLKTFKRIRGFQDEPGQVIHPLVFKHPITDEGTMCLSLGKLSRFIMDHGTPSERQMEKEETESFEHDINTEIRRGDDALLYKHKWANGDVIITDNLAVGHMASNGTQRSREDIGLRILHRTVTKGTVSPHDAHITAKNQKCILM